jgi:proline utilization trans-activator
LATRPVLLHVLEISRPNNLTDPLGRTSQIPAHVNTIAEACIHAARHSNELLTEAWTEGTLATFGYFDAQYIFSSAVVLEIASILNSQSIDSTLMQSSAHQLQFMAESGNLAATEFCGHLDAVKLACEEYRSQVAISANTSATLNADEANQEAPAVGMQFDCFTTERALAQGSMRDFLNEDVFPFDLPDVTSLVDGTSSFFYDLPMEL